MSAKRPITQDGLNSVRTLTDSTGAAVNNYDYLAFGQSYSPSTAITLDQRYTYTGRETNATSPLMYYRYRNYAPTLGRFDARDPIGYRGGINIYCYANTSPVNYLDSMGLPFCRPLMATQKKPLPPWKIVATLGGFEITKKTWVQTGFLYIDYHFTRTHKAMQLICRCPCYVTKGGKEVLSKTASKDVVITMNLTEFTEKKRITLRVFGDYAGTYPTIIGTIPYVVTQPVSLVGVVAGHISDAIFSKLLTSLTRQNIPKEAVPAIEHGLKQIKSIPPGDSFVKVPGYMCPPPSWAPKFNGYKIRMPFRKPYTR